MAWISKSPDVFRQQNLELEIGKGHNSKNHLYSTKKVIQI